MHIANEGKISMNRRTSHPALLICIVVALIGSRTPTASAQGDPTPPPQPLSGPGGSDYAHQQVVSHKYGSGETSYYLYEPASPRPLSAPVVVLVHGFTAVDPATYQAWINHIVKKGKIVIFPVYQVRGTPFDQFTRNALIGVRNALVELQNGQHVAPELDKFAITGHSCGGAITADLAAQAVTYGLPAPDVVMPVEPGCGFLPRNLNRIPAGALLVTFVGEDDTVVGDAMAKFIWNQTPQIPLANKDYLILRTDRYGTPDLVADHGAPVATLFGSTVDAMDWYGNWKLFDALTDCAWYGRYCDYALGGGPNQVGMGSWSDGRPVIPMTETKSP
jgi:acetyl esterase/lipase